MTQMLEIENISKEFGGKTVVDNVSFNVAGGEIVGLVGPNGAGKSTIIRTILGIIYPDSGNIRFLFNGENEQNGAIPRSRIGYLPEERGFYKKVKVIHILLYLAALKNYPREKAAPRIYEYFEKFGLTGKEKAGIEEFSKGMAQKVQFIASVLHEPDLLILDEPFSGLDPVSQDLFKQEIQALAASGTSILLSAHQMNMVEALCNRIFLIDKGKKVLWGDMDSIKESFADFKCVIHGDNRHINFTTLPMVERVDFQHNHTTIYFKKGSNPEQFLKNLPGDVQIRELHMDRISLHDIFVSIVTRGEQNA